MRPPLLTSLFFFLAALAWALLPPWAAQAAARRLADPRADVPALEQQLLRAGHSALPALHRGLSAENLVQRARCARLLALTGDRNGDRCLLQLLARPGAPADGLPAAMAETFLLSVWMQRDAPPPAARQRALAANSPGALTSLLERSPGWTAGWVARARVSLSDGDAAEARRGALQALALEPDNFLAMVVLAQACLLLNAPEQAMVSLEHAVRLNPRLKHSLGTEVREALKALDLERARKRREHRRQEPLA